MNLAQMNATQSYSQALSEPKEWPTFASVTDHAERLVHRMHDLKTHAGNVEHRLIGAAPPEPAGQAGLSVGAPRPVDPHLVALSNALSEIERHLGGTGASLNRIADAAGVDRC